MSWIEGLEKELEEAEAAGLLRHQRVNAGGPGTEVVLDNHPVVQFASNNYLGLATHPRVVDAAKGALEAYGVGTGASRLLGGTQSIHAELEDELAKVKGLPSALVYATGSMANLGALSALLGEGDLAVLDKACHATLYDGARLSGAQMLRFPHQDLGRLEAVLAKEAAGRRRVLVAVDGVYSMEGDVAPLPALLELTARHGALLLVDDAHATGVLGETGRGTLEHYGLAAPEHLIVTGTLSKALGSLGGFVAGPRVLTEYLINRSRSFIFATGLPACCAAAALESLRVLRDEPGLLARLRENRRELAEGLAALGWDLGESTTPILPVLVGPAEEALRLQERLWRAGYYAPAVRPPTVPAGACRLRLSVSADHTREQVLGLLRAFGERP